MIFQPHSHRLCDKTGFQCFASSIKNMKDIHSSLSIQISYILYANDKSIFARNMLAVAYTSLLDMLNGQATQNLLPGNSLLLISYLHLCQRK